MSNGLQVSAPSFALIQESGTSFSQARSTDGCAAENRKGIVEGEVHCHLTSLDGARSAF